MKRRALSLLLAGSVGSLSLAGCGAPPPQTARNVDRNVDRTGIEARPLTGSGTLTGARMARQFASQLEAQTGRKPILRGDQVILKTASSDDAVYDFRETPQTGMVTFRAGDLETRFKWSPKDQIGNQAIAAILIAIAVKMVWGGTVAFVKYYLKHPGDQFNKRECVKAIVYGMVAEGLTAIPVVGGVLSGLLWPIAWKWVEKWLDEHLPFNPKTILRMGMELSNEVASALHEAVELSSVR